MKDGLERLVEGAREDPKQVDNLKHNHGNLEKNDEEPNWCTDDKDWFERALGGRISRTWWLVMGHKSKSIT